MRAKIAVLLYCSTVLALSVTIPRVYAGDSVPEWARGAVWYQILPERFRNSNAFDDPTKDDVFDSRDGDWQIHPWASDWYKLQVWEREEKASFAELLAQRRYGGDLVGVMEKLPYLEALGVDVVYLTPIFEAPSITKYDASTLHHVDNNFGVARDEDRKIIEAGGDDPAKWELTKGDELFSEILRDGHVADLHFVIEVVFSYCGSEFWAFQDLKKKQKGSRYKDWFQVISWDDPMTPDTVEFDYAAWQNDKNLPLFKTDDLGAPVQPVKEYIFNITRRWMDVDGDPLTADGVDGWSVRHVEGYSVSFWREWNELVRDLKADAITTSDLQSSSDQFINRYGFTFSNRNELANLITDFFVHRKNPVRIVDFVAKLDDLRQRLEGGEDFSSLVQLSNLDGPRIASVIAKSKRAKSSNGHAHNGDHPVKPDSSERKIQKLLTIFQLTCPGSPVIYYGDESGMWGGDPPDNIKPMLWKEFLYERESYRALYQNLEQTSDNRFELGLFNMYRGLNELRSENPALRIGEFRVQLTDDDKGIFVYSRRHKSNEVWVFMNLSDEEQHVEINPGWKKNRKVIEAFSTKKYKLDKFDIKLTLEPISARVLVKEK